MIHVFASESHFLDHLAPVVELLRQQVEVELTCLDPAFDHAAGLDIECAYGRPSGAPTLVASYKDTGYTRGPVMLLNHGAGQTYTLEGNAHPSYSGGRNRERVGLYLCPGEQDAQVNARAWPEARVVTVGCPKLDRWHRLRRPRRPNDPPVVAIAHHYDLDLCPETHWALPHFVSAYPEIARHWKVLGHGHPRAMGDLRPVYEAAGIELVTRFDEVIDRADVLVADNSSVGWEWMTLGRPVVWLNASWYRREVEHGLRFWHWADAGVQCAEPAHLVEAIGWAIADPLSVAWRREQAVRHIYGECDGKASERAARAILSYVGDGSYRIPRMADPYRPRPKPEPEPEVQPEGESEAVTVPPRRGRTRRT